jgi:hypothetical protein
MDAVITTDPSNAISPDDPETGSVGDPTLSDSSTSLSFIFANRTSDNGESISISGVVI